MKLPKLEIRRGPYRGMCGGNDVYDAPYYSVKEVEDYKKAVISHKEKAASEIKKLRFELLMVAKAAADKPMFLNPLNAAHAKKIRDRVLSEAQVYGTTTTESK